MPPASTWHAKAGVVFDTEKSPVTGSHGTFIIVLLATTTRLHPRRPPRRYIEAVAKIEQLPIEGLANQRS